MEPLRSWRNGTAPQELSVNSMTNENADVRLEMIMLVAALLGPDVNNPQ